MHAVHHLEGALDLAAEVGVTGRVHDIDARAVIEDGGVLRHDGDALLALEVDRVHHPLGDRLMLTEDAALPEHRIHQGGLAVVDVGDDRQVADVVSRLDLVHRRSVLERGVKGACGPVRRRRPQGDGEDTTALPAL